MPETREIRPGVIMCVCTGKCPGFEKMDIWDFINRVRIELPVEFGIIHPQLCEEDGDRFLADFLEAGRPLVIAGCAPNMQYKLFRDAFTAHGMDVKTDMVPLDIREMTTDDAVAKVQSALRSMGFEETSATDAEADSGKDGVANG
jgi:heterodisulfide reductase subunit A-like polyferredoxin